MTQDALILNTTFKIPANHQSLAGHFPGNPIVPGVVLLAQVEQLLQIHYPNYDLLEVVQAKFMQILLPEQLVNLNLVLMPHKELGVLKVSFKMFFDNASEQSLLASGQLNIRETRHDCR